MNAVLGILLVAGVGGVIWGLVRATQKRLIREAALDAPFPGEWEDYLESGLPPYRKLPSKLRWQLQDKIRIFLAQKSFEGCGGLVVDDEMKVLIAAQACMLLLNRETACYPKLRSVLVYPSTYVAGGKSLLGGQQEEASVRLGESWSTGAVVLAWDSVRRGALNFDDGQNVTMHEFAHQLDQADGTADGAPVLEERSAYASWAHVLSTDYLRLESAVAKGKKSVMDEYGATNPAEFFAVATETFFEKPEQLRAKHPELYEELRGFYRVNPVEWADDIA